MRGDVVFHPLDDGRRKQEEAGNCAKDAPERDPDQQARQLLWVGFAKRC